MTIAVAGMLENGNIFICSDTLLTGSYSYESSKIDYMYNSSCYFASSGVCVLSDFFKYEELDIKKNDIKKSVYNLIPKYQEWLTKRKLNQECDSGMFFDGSFLFVSNLEVVQLTNFFRVKHLDLDFDKKQILHIGSGGPIFRSIFEHEIRVNKKKVTEKLIKNIFETVFYLDPNSGGKIDFIELG